MYVFILKLLDTPGQTNMSPLDRLRSKFRQRKKLHTPVCLLEFAAFTGDQRQTAEGESWRPASAVCLILVYEIPEVQYG